MTALVGMLCFTLGFLIGKYGKPPGGFKSNTSLGEAVLNREHDMAKGQGYDPSDDRK